MLDWDLETDKFGPSNLAPEPICLSLADDDGNRLIVAHCEPQFDEILVYCLESEQCNTNIAFDMAVILAWRPHLAEKVWKAYRDGRVHDLIVREKLLMLADTGDLKYRNLPNGAKEKLKFSQAAIEMRRLGIDRSADKDEDDAWRSNYVALKGIPAADYPEEASRYSLEDSDLGLQIFHHQEAENTASSYNAFGPELLNTRAALALQLSSCWGFAVDFEMVEKLYGELSERYHERNYGELVASGILRPSTPARPHANQLKKAVAAVGCTPIDWQPHREKLEALGIRFTEPEESSYNTKKLKELFKATCDTVGIECKLTDGGDVSTDKEMQESLKGFNPTIDEYIDRAEIKTLVTQELPRMRAGRVHPRYDILKETGRTSSFGNNKKDKEPAYPSTNIQKIDKRAREAFIASPGHVLCSVDYNYIELVSVAQKCLELFDESVLADKINAGYDPHAYLGAAIARVLDHEFKHSNDADENYQSFLALKKTDSDRYKHWRTLAKPTGLGFPGGLGAARFVGYAKANFGVDIIKIAGSLQAAISLAEQLKIEWRRTYPEMDAYFAWIRNNCQDMDWSSPEAPKFVYVSPHGMVRRNCLYTEASNGAALQTPTAEGAKISLWDLVQATHDASLNNLLLGCHMVAFIHDEVIVELPIDDSLHERAFEVARIMKEGMSRVMTRVKVGAEPALMLRWNKAAEAVYGPDKRILIWQPKAA